MHYVLFMCSVDYVSFHHTLQSSIYITVCIHTHPISAVGCAVLLAAHVRWSLPPGSTKLARVCWYRVLYHRLCRAAIAEVFGKSKPCLYALGARAYINTGELGMFMGVAT